MKAEIVCVGTELLLGEIVDTNASYLARCLAAEGIDLYYKSTVGDNLERAAATIRMALGRADVVITSGGLGPTLDDLTREAIADAVGEPLESDPEAMRFIEERFGRLGRPMPESNRRQAMMPRGARTIPNPMGTAPGVWLEKDGKIVVALPGVPRELKVMTEQTVIPWLLMHIPAGEHKVLRSRVLRLTGIGESAMEERIMPLIEGQRNPTIAPYAGEGECRLRLTASAAAEQQAIWMLDELEGRVRQTLGRHIYGYEQDTLESVIIGRLKNAGKRLAVAESCTGGLVSHRLTNVPGSSEAFFEGVVTYDNRSKSTRLGVPAELITARGAVSEPVARAMAEGIRKTSGCDYGVATTGIAGPGGGTDAKPVGLVYVAASGPLETRVIERRFAYDRAANKHSFSQAALDLLWQLMRDEES